MLRVPCSEGASRASKSVAASGSETPTTAANGSDENEWFKQVARLLGKDAGLHLHHITGYPERSCYYYASGERTPPTDFLRRLFHSPHGEPFMLSFMQCDAPWWLDYQKHKRMGEAAERAR